jgi:predicted transcriptional regulator
LPGGDLEYAVLSKLWELGSASARDIHTQVGEPAKLVCTTTANVLDRLHAKHLVSVCALRFFYHHTLHRDWIIEHIPYPRHEQKLPVRYLALLVGAEVFARQSVRAPR